MFIPTIPLILPPDDQVPTGPINPIILPRHLSAHIQKNLRSPQRLIQLKHMLKNILEVVKYTCLLWLKNRPYKDYNGYLNDIDYFFSRYSLIATTTSKIDSYEFYGQLSIPRVFPEWLDRVGPMERKDYSQDFLRILYEYLRYQNNGIDHLIIFNSNSNSDGSYKFSYYSQEFYDKVKYQITKDVFMYKSYDDQWMIPSSVNNYYYDRHSFKTSANSIVFMDNLEYKDFIYQINNQLQVSSIIYSSMMSNLSPIIYLRKIEQSEYYYILQNTSSGSLLEAFNLAMHWYQYKINLGIHGGRFDKPLEIINYYIYTSDINISGQLIPIDRSENAILEGVDILEIYKYPETGTYAALLPLF
jgi:hypothetical protein